MRKFLFWPVTFLLAIVIGAFTFAYLRSSYPEQFQVQSAASNVQTVVVAAKDIPLRRSITAQDLVEQEVAYGALPQGAVTSIDDVVGMMVTSEVLQGETMLTQQLAVAGAVIQQIALTIPDSKVLVPIPIQSQLISVGLVQPGSHVDLFGTFVADEVLGVTFEDASETLLVAENAAETVAVLQNLEVHAIIIEPRTVSELVIEEVDTDSDADSETDETDDEDGVFYTRVQNEQAILVALDRQDSVIVNHLLDTEDLLDIALRSPDDTTLADVTNVDIFYLASRYGIKLLRDDAVVMSEELFQANPGQYAMTGAGPSPEFLNSIGER